MEKIVVTGMGALTPIGNNASDFYENALNGVNGIGPVTLFDTEPFKVKLAAEVKNFDLSALDKKAARRMDRFSQFAVAAAIQAVADSGLDIESMDKTRLGVVVGSGIGGLDVTTKESIKLHEQGPARVSPLMVPMIIANMAAGNIAIQFGARGVCTCSVTACAAGATNIGEAVRYIRDGYADVIIAGGAEAAITPLGLAGFINITALSNSDDANRASIPFDAERSGFVMGEGAGILVLESESHAKKRGARIYASVLGYGATGDGYHITAPLPDGAGAARAMQQAMRQAGITPEQVSYINAHGTGTPPNDVAETQAVKIALGAAAKTVPVSSTKSMVGHMLGAAGAAEAIICVYAVYKDAIPPTINYRMPDPQCDLDVVPHTARELPVEYALSNSLGFGGHNASLLFGKYKS